MQFNKELLEKARKTFYAVYVDTFSDGAYIGSETDTEGDRIRVIPTPWEYSPEYEIDNDEELASIIAEFTDDPEEDVVNCDSVNYDSVVAEAAAKLGVSVDRFKRMVFDEYTEICDTEDVIAWLDYRYPYYTDEDVKAIVADYRNDYNCDLGTWDNVESAVTNYFADKKQKENEANG